jgi:hypothetical protein
MALTDAPVVSRLPILLGKLATSSNGSYRAQRRLPPRSAETERLALKAFALFRAGYTREAALIRALRDDG